MKKYKVLVDCDYVAGHLRYGYLETEVEAESLEEAIKIAEERGDFNLKVTDYEVDDYMVNWDSISAKEITTGA